jgi:hypothetical protein
MAIGRLQASSAIGAISQAEMHLMYAKVILTSLPPTPLQELLLLWTTVILADILAEHDYDTGHAAIVVA